MSLLQQIKDRSLVARKCKERMASFLITLYSEASRPGLDAGKRESTDEEVTRVLKKFKDGAQEMVTNLTILCNDATLIGGAVDYFTKREMARLEIKLIDSFLPQQMEENVLREVISNYIFLDNLTNLGQVMSKLKQYNTGQYDGAIASKLAKELLA